jgi:hypothetical protein
MGDIFWLRRDRTLPFPKNKGSSKDILSLGPTHQLLCIPNVLRFDYLARRDQLVRSNVIHGDRKRITDTCSTVAIFRSWPGSYTLSRAPIAATVVYETPLGVSSKGATKTGC